MLVPNSTRSVTSPGHIPTLFMFEIGKKVYPILAKLVSSLPDIKSPVRSSTIAYINHVPSTPSRADPPSRRSSAQRTTSSLGSSPPITAKARSELMLAAYPSMVGSPASGYNPRDRFLARRLSRLLIGYGGAIPSTTRGPASPGHRHVKGVGAKAQETSLRAPASPVAALAAKAVTPPPSRGTGHSTNRRRGDRIRIDLPSLLLLAP